MLDYTQMNLFCLSTVPFPLRPCPKFRNIPLSSRTDVRDLRFLAPLEMTREKRRGFGHCYTVSRARMRGVHKHPHLNPLPSRERRPRHEMRKSFQTRMLIVLIIAFVT